MKLNITTLQIIAFVGTGVNLVATKLLEPKLEAKAKEEQINLIKEIMETEFAKRGL